MRTRKEPDACRDALPQPALSDVISCGIDVPQAIVIELSPSVPGLALGTDSAGNELVLLP